MKTILLIDDERVFRVLLRDELQDHGWRVLEASDGEAGIQMALQERPDVVVCDLLMPRTNGYQVCRALRAQRDLLPHTRIIVTTASGYDTDRINALDAGADEFLIKPVRPALLLKVLSTFNIGGEGGVPAFSGGPSGALQGVRLKFWGVRGSIPTPGSATIHYGGNTSCVEVRADGELIVLDAGTGIRSLGLSLIEEFKEVPINVTLLITHTHWDHIQGFPFFPVAYNPKNNIRVLAFEGARKSLESTLSGQMESPYFPISMQQMPGNIRIEELKDMGFQVGAVTVEAVFTNHPGICVCFRITTSGGKIAYVPDNELFQRLRKSQSAPAEEQLETDEFASRRDARLCEFVRGCDVLIMDCQYDAEEYPKYVGWGHSCVDDSVALAVEAGVKQFFLFHHDPGHDDAKVAKMVENARALGVQLGAKFPIEAAREGLEIVLKPVPTA